MLRKKYVSSANFVYRFWREGSLTNQSLLYTHGHGVWLQGGGFKIFVFRRVDSDYCSREGVSFCVAGGEGGGGTNKKYSP